MNGGHTPLVDFGSELRALNKLAARLAFRLDDTNQANAVYVLWATRKREDAKEQVDVWTYCFIRAYFLRKFTLESGWQVSELDALIAETYEKVETKAASIRDPSRYAQWVSVVCKNSFFDYLQSRRRVVPLPQDDMLPAEPEADLPPDPHSVHAAIGDAVRRLPGAWQDVAYLRFIENQSYEEIGRTTGRPLPTIRAYAKKAMDRFRSDPKLRALQDSLLTILIIVPASLTG